MTLALQNLKRKKGKGLRPVKGQELGQEQLQLEKSLLLEKGLNIPLKMKQVTKIPRKIVGELFQEELLLQLVIKKIVAKIKQIQKTCWRQIQLKPLFLNLKRKLKRLRRYQLIEEVKGEVSIYIATILHNSLLWQTVSEI